MALHPREGGRKNLFGLTKAEMNRRDFLRRSGLTAASIPLASAILAACGTGTPDPGTSPQIPLARPNNPVTLEISADNPPIEDGLKPEAGPLEIYNWEEYINPRAVSAFEEQYGVKVNVNTFNTANDALATLTTATDVKFDVYFPTVDQIGKLVATRLLKPLNKSYIPNLQNAWSVYTGDEANQPFYDVGAQYSVPYTVYTTGVAWRIDEGGPSEDDVTGLDNPYDILWDSRWKGKTHILDDYREAIGMTLLKNGITDINTDDEATRSQNLATAKEELLDLIAKVDVQADVSDYTDLPEAKSLVHQAWSGDMISGQYYFPAGTSDKDVIRYWAPETGMAIGNDLIAVLNSGANPVLAHLFLNFMLDFNEADTTGNSILNFQFNGYLPPMAGLKKEDLIKKPDVPFSMGRVVQPSLETCIPSEEDFSIGYQLLELSPDVDSQWKEVWEAFQTG